MGGFDDLGHFFGGRKLRVVEGRVCNPVRFCGVVIPRCFLDRAEKLSAMSCEAVKEIVRGFEGFRSFLKEGVLLFMFDGAGGGELRGEEGFFSAGEL